MSRTSSPAVVFGLAVGGVLGGHALTYRLLLPDAHTRAEELTHTGHGYLGGANTLGVVVVMIALAVLFLGRVLGREHVPGGDVALRLWAFQLAAFGSMEVLERLSSGSGPHHLLPLLLVGFPAQALVAAVMALIVRIALRVAATIAEQAGRGNALRLPAAFMSLGAEASILLVRSPGTPPGRAPPLVVP